MVARARSSAHVLEVYVYGPHVLGALALALSLIVSPSSALAQASHAVPLSLADAISLAESHAPEVALARHAVRQAEAQRVGAGVVMPQNPRLSVDARPVLRGGSPSDVGYAATLDTLFDVGGAPSARVREADRGADVAAAELTMERREARARAWATYVRVLVASERVREARSATEISERVLRAARERADAGAAGDIDRTLAESELAQATANVSLAEQARERAIMDLRDALDLPADAALVLTTPLVSPGDVPPVEALTQRALVRRADLATIQKRVDLLSARRDRLEREVFPRVGAYLGVDASPLSPLLGLVGVTVELPVAQRNQGPLARVSAESEGERERLALSARRALREVRERVDAYDARRRELSLFESGSVPSATRTLELVESGWRAGRFDVFRVTSAARDLERARSLRLDALEAAWLERIALDRAVGGLE